MTKLGGGSTCAATWLRCAIGSTKRACYRPQLLVLGFFVGSIPSACTPISKAPSAMEREQSKNMVSTARVRPGQCAEDEDCPVYSPCLTVYCEEGTCVERPAESGTVLSEDQQVEGDCKTLTCDGRGQARNRPDDSDTPNNQGTACQIVECSDGQAKTVNAPASTICNQTGSCQAGSCSVCVEGEECTRADDCTVYKYRCVSGEEECADTGIALNGKVCGAGKICRDGSCVPCVIGALCDVDMPCHEGRITSCESGIECQPHPVTGPSCGDDSDGYCIEGRCEKSCREGTCEMPLADACQEARFVCASDAEPGCVMVPREDGTACGEAASCHAGKCVRSALNNGDFGRGLQGWTTQGDAAQFVVTEVEGRRVVSTTAADRGALSQTFTVPDDAISLHFAVSGGHAHVRLKDESGQVLQDCVGQDSDERLIPVSWPLSGARGQKVTIAVEDDLSEGDWAFITTTGFDVVRESESPLRNPQFTRALDGWETTGDGLHFYVYDAYSYFTGSAANMQGETMYGLRRAITTYVREDGGAASGFASRGTVSQTFTVPSDAVALRFHTCGGRAAQVKLQSQGQTLYSASGIDSDSTQVVNNWPLQAHRGKVVRLVVEDAAGVGLFDYVGTSGFDLITSYNGP